MASYRGNLFANYQVGTNQDDDFDMRGGDDAAYGQGGDDFMEGGSGDDSLHGGNDSDILLGEDDNDVLFGDAGDDLIDGGEGDDLLHGGSDFDFMSGGTGADELFGDEGSDLLEGGAGADLLNGGADDDVVNYASSSAAVSVNLTTGVGDGGDAEGDTLVDIENITGSRFADTLVGTSGDNVLTGAGGADHIDGGADDDLVVYRSSPVGVQVNLATGVNTGGDAAGDVLVNIEDVEGSDFGDVLTGDGGANSINGAAGIDFINGAGSNDVLFGGDGNDVLSGGSEDDVLTGEAGSDALDGGSGTDTVQMSNWNDVVDVFQTTYSITLGEGANDGAAIRTVFQSGNPIVAEHDTLRSIENVTGTNKNETITGNSVANFLRGIGGNDVIHGNGGNDIIQGGAGADVIDGGSGVDTANYVSASAGVVLDLTLGFGSGGDAAGDTFVDIERVTGSGFGDTLAGNNLSNVLDGGNGDDVLVGGGGNDTMIGGAGNDQYFVNEIGDLIFENANAGNDIVNAAIDFTIGANVESVVLVQGAGNLNATGSSVDNALVGNSGNNVLNGKGAHDLLTGNGGIDTFVFGAGEADGDAIVDFAGNGALPGDSLQFLGFGSAAQGATFTQLNATQWQIHSGLDGHNEVITLQNGASVDQSDIFFA